MRYPRLSACRSLGRCSTAVFRFAWCRGWEFFFFQAEDGIRDIGVTGVQTCALPISAAGCRGTLGMRRGHRVVAGIEHVEVGVCRLVAQFLVQQPVHAEPHGPLDQFFRADLGDALARSEERRVGKECRYRWWGEG